MSRINTLIGSKHQQVRLNKFSHTHKRQARCPHRVYYGLLSSQAGKNVMWWLVRTPTIGGDNTLTQQTNAKRGVLTKLKLRLCILDAFSVPVRAGSLEKTLR